MATLAQHVPAIAAAKIRSRGSSRLVHLLEKGGSRGDFHRRDSSRLCVAVLALRMAFVPIALIPRDIAFTGVGLATLAAVAAFVGAGHLRKRVAADG